MTYQLMHGDARSVSDLLPAESVDLIVTSPPYFALRSYRDGGEHYDGQIGSEPTPSDFLDALVACTADWMRALKPSGSLWVNLGDKYAGGGGPQTKYGMVQGASTPASSSIAPDVPSKSLMGLPWRYALRCVDELGLILRAEVIWSKPNGLPESVTDRVRRSHEQWFHFTRQGRYFAAVDEVREAHADPRTGANGKTARDHHTIDLSRKWNPTDNDYNPLGKLPGSVWTVPTEPLTVPADLGVDHFAAFPSEWPRRIILGWSPSGICTACGDGRRPVVAKELVVLHEQVNNRFVSDLSTDLKPRTDGLHGDRRKVGENVATITGYACACPDADAPTTPAVVLDPFCGTGTTVAVAHHLGRHGIGVDLSRDYLRLAEWRITSDTGLRDKVLDRSGRPAAPDIDGQLDLFSGAA